MEAATRVIVAQGLSAPTAGIAREAGVGNGSFFTYFDTKVDLFNQLYLELKTDVASPATRAGAHKTMTGIAELLERSRANGPMRKAPMGFVVAIMNSVAETTMDFMAQDPTNAQKHCKAGFDAVWRMIA
jgi:AcrR family transcriptional regulator